MSDRTEYYDAMCGNTSTYTEDKITISGVNKQMIVSHYNPMELVETAIRFLELSKEKNWKLLDSRGLEISRKLTIDDYIERLKNAK